MKLKAVKEKGIGRKEESGASEQALPRVLECWRNVSFVLSIHVLQGSDRGLLNDMIYIRQIL